MALVEPVPTKIIEATLSVQGPISEDQFRRLEELTGRAPSRFKDWASWFHFALPTDRDPHRHPAVVFCREQDRPFTLEVRSESVAQEPTLDAQIAAAWERLHAESDTLTALTLRRVAAVLAERHQGAATLRLVIRDPDEPGVPDGWSVDEDGLLDADGQVLVEGDPAGLDDLLRLDLDTLAFTEDVYPAVVIDLRADPPTMTAVVDPMDTCRFVYTWARSEEERRRELLAHLITDHGRPAWKSGYYLHELETEHEALACDVDNTERAELAREDPPVLPNPSADHPPTGRSTQDAIDLEVDL